MTTAPIRKAAGDPGLGTTHTTFEEHLCDAKPAPMGYSPDGETKSEAAGQGMKTVSGISVVRKVSALCSQLTFSNPVDQSYTMPCTIGHEQR